MPINVIILRWAYVHFIDLCFYQVGDFGLARTMASASAYAQTRAGTQYYMRCALKICFLEICFEFSFQYLYLFVFSPEAQNGQYGLLSDVWALGVILFELWYVFNHVPIYAKGVARIHASWSYIQIICFRSVCSKHSETSFCQVGWHHGSDQTNSKDQGPHGQIWQRQLGPFKLALYHIIFTSNYNSAGGKT